MPDVLYKCSKHVAEITINRPDKANALNTAVREGLFDAFRKAEADSDCRVIILTAAGQKVFCAGADLVEMALLGITVPPPDYMPVLHKNIEISKPVIAAVNGAALAGGFLLVQMCDLIVASRTASFAVTEANPRFIDGARNCPPEDCGGIPGFYEMLEAKADRDHPDHADITQWLDGYDPDQLDLFPIKVALDRIAARRNAAAKRIIKPLGD